MHLLRSNCRNIAKNRYNQTMFSSQEVRWFFDGSIEQFPALRSWVEDGARNPQWIGRLGGKPDTYVVVPGGIDMGIKWREGQFQLNELSRVAADFGCTWLTRPSELLISTEKCGTLGMLA